MKLTKKWLFLIVAVPIVGLCINAGFWQLDRASEKEQLIKRLVEGNDAILNASDYISVDVSESAYRMRVSVARQDGDILYLDNRIQNRVAGYDVMAQYLINGTEAVVWVNLGWVAGGISRADLPEVNVPSHFELEGLLVKTPESFQMTDAQSERFGSRVRVQALTSSVDQLVFAENVLNRDAIGPRPRLGPETHYGYSVQWFLMALVLAGLTAYVFRREFN